MSEVLDGDHERGRKAYVDDDEIEALRRRAIRMSENAAAGKSGYRISYDQRVSSELDVPQTYCDSGKASSPRASGR